MKVNDVRRKGEVALRVLAIKGDLCFCINCNADYMPAWMPITTLDEYSPDTAPIIDTNMTAKQKQVAHERYTMIAPMLVFLTDDKERNRLMNRIATEQEVSKQTLRRYSAYLSDANSAWTPSFSCCISSCVLLMRFLLSHTANEIIRWPLRTNVSLL